jgi:hypothetical protein
LTLTVTALAPVPAGAEEASVPVGVQAQLVAKVAGYDRNLPPRAQNRLVRVLIVARGGDGASARAAMQAKRSLSEIGAIGGFPHEEEVVTWAGPDALVDACRARRASIVFLMPGLEAESAAAGKALAGVDVLSAGAGPGVAQKGVVLGFDLVSGRPAIVVNMGQAKRQNVSLKPELLKLAKVIE